MQWLRELFADPTSVESTLLILALVIALGLAVGHVSVRGIRLGVAAILFVGLAFGHFGLTPNPAVLSFTREFGLVLFVFAVGLSVGPGFFNALRRRGLPLNVMAAAIVMLGVLITTALMLFVGITAPIAIGLFSGSTTNTPSLAAAGQAMRDSPPTTEAARKALAQVNPNHPLVQAEQLDDQQQQQLLSEVTKLPAMAYAISYPGGVFGIILAILLLRMLFRIDVEAESKAIEEQNRLETPPLASLHIKVANSNLFGVKIGDIPAIESLGVVVSRVLRGADEMVASDSLALHQGDVLRAVGLPEKLRQFSLIVGEQLAGDVPSTNSQIHVQWVTVSKNEWAERTVEELASSERFGVQLTRIRRSNVELPPMAHMRFMLGDQIRVVGLPQNIAKVAAELGDSTRQLAEPHFGPVFLGIALGVIVGSIPIAFPGMNATVKLGLAGGPLLIAIVLSRLHRVGPIVWYLPRSANLALRDIGIAVFLASVGLRSGDLFMETFLQGDGLLWLGAGALITVTPLLVVGIAARIFAKEHYPTITGLLAGSMTDPPALAFANSLAGSEIPSIAYATVYPLTMILRIISAQLMMIYWTS